MFLVAIKVMCLVCVQRAGKPHTCVYIFLFSWTDCKCYFNCVVTLTINFVSSLKNTADAGLKEQPTCTHTHKHLVLLKESSQLSLRFTPSLHSYKFQLATLTGPVDFHTCLHQPCVKTFTSTLFRCNGTITRPSIMHRDKYKQTYCPSGLIDRT